MGKRNLSMGKYTWQRSVSQRKDKDIKAGFAERNIFFRSVSASLGLVFCPWLGLAMIQIGSKEM